MQGDVEAHRQKVRLQLCATTATSQAGQPFWSNPVQLDALGGAAVVEAPCPMTAAPSHKEAQAGFQLAVTAVQVGSAPLHAAWLFMTTLYPYAACLLVGKLPCAACVPISNHSSFLLCMKVLHAQQLP